MDVLNKRVLVVGLGKSGLSAAHWLSREGAEVTVSDMKTEAELDPVLLKEALGFGIHLETGGHLTGTFLKQDTIIVSPGVPLDIGPLKAAKEMGIPIMGEMELAVGLIDVPILAVTGTNGKSTATAFLGFMMKRAGFEVFVGGNIGTPLIDYAGTDRKAHYAVVEVSSFQLDTMEKFCPSVSLLLNISPDHLDRYPDYEAYVQSKLTIFRNQGAGHYAIMNDDDHVLSNFKPPENVSLLRYGMEKKRRRQAFMEGKRIRACLPGMEAHHFNLEKFRLPGRHNLENVMGVILAGLSLRIKPQTIQEAIDHFQGLPHRLELIGSSKGVDFYDDSKATNVDAAARAITSFSKPIVLIAGGRHKGGDYSPLVKVAAGRVKKAVFLGEAKYLLAQAFDGIIPFTLAEDMEDAVSQAVSSARQNDVVLLAPACASFDMFSDYGQRGRVFKETVERLLGHWS